MKKEYSGECFGAFGAGYNIGYRQAKRDIRSLIERDKAKKPIREGNRQFDSCCCSNCGDYLACICDIPFCIDDEHNFCQRCGQRIDWSND